MTTLLTIPETAERLRVSERTVRNLITRGELRPKHVGRRVFITDTEIETYATRPDRRRLA